MSPPRIRAATLDDAAAIAGLHVRAWQAAYRGLVPDDVLDGLDVAAWTERRRQALAQPRTQATRNWVLEGESRLLGWAVAGPTRDADLDAGRDAGRDAGPAAGPVGEVYAIYLEPAAVGRGHGRALMQHTLAALVGQGFREVALWVLEHNLRARRFYDAAGFRLDAAAPERHVTIQDRHLDAPEVRLRRPLP